MEKQIVGIDYTNHRGERATRRIIPIRIGFTTVDWHPDEQWILFAWDIDKKGDRCFSMDKIHEWTAIGTIVP